MHWRIRGVDWVNSIVLPCAHLEHWWFGRKLWSFIDCAVNNLLPAIFSLQSGRYCCWSLRCVCSCGHVRKHDRFWAAGERLPSDLSWLLLWAFVADGPKWDCPKNWCVSWNVQHVHLHVLVHEVASDWFSRRLVIRVSPLLMAVMYCGRAQKWDCLQMVAFAYSSEIKYVV